MGMTIELTQGQFALVDEGDYESLMQWKWCALWNKNTRSFYAARKEPNGKGRQKTIRMHRHLLGLAKGDKRTGDHENHNTLDNRRSNLRIATHSEQNCNKGITARNSSGFKGVRYRKDRSAWLAEIRVHGKLIYLGQRSTREEAHALFCDAAKKYHGEFARVK